MARATTTTDLLSVSVFWSFWPHVKRTRGHVLEEVILLDWVDTRFAAFNVWTKIIQRKGRLPKKSKNLKMISCERSCTLEKWKSPWLFRLYWGVFFCRGVFHACHCATVSGWSTVLCVLKLQWCLNTVPFWLASLLSEHGAFFLKQSLDILLKVVSFLFKTVPLFVWNSFYVEGTQPLPCSCLCFCRPKSCFFVLFSGGEH